MSSVGQAVGMVIGGTIGFFAGGNVMLGASIGGAIGGYIDPPKGQNSVGPRLEDLTVQTSTYGAILPRIKGTVAVTGNVFWLEGDRIKEHVKTKKVGGKGGPTSKQTTYSYSATFAVSLAHCVTGPVAGIRRLWLANTLVYDAGSTDLQSIIASNLQEGVVFKVYDGRDDQEPDPRMQADKGAANVSGYPGRASIFFYDLDLTEHYSNTLMAVQAKVELVCGNPGTPAHYALFTAPDLGVDGGTGAIRQVVSAVVSPQQTDYAVCILSAGYDFYGMRYYSARYGEYAKQTGAFDYTLVASYGHTTPATINVHHNRDGDLHFVVSQGLYLLSQTVFYFVSRSGVTVSRAYTTAEVAYGYYSIAACDLTQTFMADPGSAKPILRFSSTDLAATSATSIQAKTIALSETRVFVVDYSGASSIFSRVYVLDRESLALVATYTGAVGSAGVVALDVVSDDEFYLVADAEVSHWVSGVAVSVGNVLTSPAGAYLYRQVVVSQEPAAYYDFRAISGAFAMGGELTTITLNAQSAKLHDIITDECALVGIASGDLDLSGLTNHDVRGYRQSGGIRGALEQLQAAFPFDVLQSGYKIKFKDRGGAAGLTVPESDLGAHTGSDTPVRFSTLLEMPTQVPAKVKFNFLNADREYDPDEQSASYTAQDVKNSYSVSLPLVMTATEAIRAADVLLKKEQIERTSVSPFWLPPTDAYRKLEAADVVDVVAQGRTHTVRLTKVTNLPDGRIECEGRLTASAAYVSSAEAQDSLALGQSLVALKGSSELILLDIPRMTVDQDVPGISAGMFGYSTAWPGGVALRSDDSGESFSTVAAFDTKTEVFTVSGTPASVLPYTVDVTTVLTVTPDWPGADLYSITETQLYAMGNIAAYGADGRWEIVAFKTVVDNTGSYTISDFLRGRFGTEWAMSMHADGDKLVMLDIDAQDFMGLPLSAINSPRLWRGVTSGASVDSVADLADTYEAHNLKPYAPCDLNGWRTALDGDWTLEFQPRSRTPVEIFSGLPTPSGETISSYELDIYDAAYSTVKRTITSATPSFSYSGALQVLDFGTIQGTVYVKGYQLSATVGRGYPLVASLNRVTDEDPYAPQVTSLLHFNGTNGATTITDVIVANTWTAAGNAQLSTSSPIYGASSLLCDGASDYIYGNGSSNFSYGTGDFTIELSVVPNATGVAQVLVDFRPSGTNGAYPYIDLSASNVVGYFVNSAYRITGTTSLSVGTKYHIRISRVSGTTRLFVNGVQEGGSYGDSFSYAVGANRPVIGANGASAGANGFNGKIDEWRSTKAGRSSSNFTPPSAEFPNP